MKDFLDLDRYPLDREGSPSGGSLVDQSVSGAGS